MHRQHLYGLLLHLHLFVILLELFLGSERGELSLVEVETGTIVHSFIGHKYVNCYSGVMTVLVWSGTTNVLKAHVIA